MRVPGAPFRLQSWSSFELRGLSFRVGAVGRGEPQLGIGLGFGIRSPSWGVRGVWLRILPAACRLDATEVHRGLIPTSTGTRGHEWRASLPRRVDPRPGRARRRGAPLSEEGAGPPPAQGRRQLRPEVGHGAWRARGVGVAAREAHGPRGRRPPTLKGSRATRERPWLE